MPVNLRPLCGCTKNALGKSLDALIRLDADLAAVADAVDAVMTSDRKKAEAVIDNDIEIDHFELDVEEECLKILALHQPVAGDLRYVIACLKMNNDLERIGDLAVNIAKRARSF